MGDSVIAGISLSPTAILQAVSKGIGGGFAGLGHTVDVWIFGIAGGVLLFLLFNTHIFYMLKTLAGWLQLTSTSQHTLTHMAILGKTSHQVVNYSLWTPGAWAYSAGTGSAGGSILHIGWTPAWAVLVGGVWIIGLVLGILALLRGQRLGRPVMLLAPLATGILVFAAPSVLPALLTAVWHLVDTHGLILAIGHTIGLTASQSRQWLANPFWIWGATLGISGAHGLSLGKLLLFVPTTAIALIPKIVSDLLSMTGVTTGSMTFDGAVASWIYGIMHISMIVSIGMTFLLAIWSLLLFTAALWLGLSPVWVWIVALDPWSFDLAMMIGGLVLRAMAVQVSAWVWVTGVVILDGGSHHGPLGLPLVFTGLTPWLSLAWTLGWIVLVWRFWMVPLWLMIRRVEVDVATWWTQTQVRLAAATGQAGQQIKASGAAITATGIGGTPGEWGQALQAGGDTLTTRSQQWADEAAWHGANLQWSERERQWGQRARIGSEDNWLMHPAGWAMRDGSRQAPDAQESAGPPIHWQADMLPQTAEDGEAMESIPILSATMESADAAQSLAQTMTKTMQAEAVRTRAESLVHHNQDFLDSIAHLPDNLHEQSITNQINRQITEWNSKPAAYPQDIFSEIPRIETQGSRVQVHPPAGQSAISPTLMTRLQTIAQTTRSKSSRPLTRERWGVTEVYQNGLWVAQSSHDKEES